MPEDDTAKPKTRAPAGQDDLTQFLAVVSHELRTPLSASLTTIDLLAETGLDSRQRDYLATLRDAVQSGLALTDLLLSMHRNDGDAVEDADPFIPGDIIRSVVSLMKPRAEKLGLSIGFDIAPSAGQPATGAKVAIRQALTALIDNAVKYTPSGAIGVAARVDSADDGDRIAIGVQDDGPGISPQQRERIFKAFERGDTGVATGYGLGLWITREIAQRAGGTLLLDSSNKDGARFVVAFPIRLEGAATRDQPLKAAGAPLSGDLLRGRRVLIVDDSAISRRLIITCLESFDIEATGAMSGYAALERPDIESFDAVIVDLLMPGMSGSEVARRIKRLDNPPPVIGLSANPAAAGGDAGLFQFLIAKPFQPADLYTTLVNTLKDRR